MIGKPFEENSTYSSLKLSQMLQVTQGSVLSHSGHKESYVVMTDKAVISWGLTEYSRYTTGLAEIRNGDSI
jgi:hypothetical protein